MIVTIDGPAGTGKTTVARLVAERMRLPYFDTGAMYRSVAFWMLKRAIPISDKAAIAQMLQDFSFEIREGGRYFACGLDVTDEIRSQAVNKIVSPVSALPPVREAIWKIQRRFAEKKGGVFEGRDMGTAVFPKAEIKIFLTARPEVRAQRRLDELIRKRPHEAEGMDRKAMLDELQKRDLCDSSRELAPLTRPIDAYVIDSSQLSIEEVVDRILEYRQKKNTKSAWLHLRGIKLLYRFVLFTTWIWTKLLYRHRVYGLEHFYPRGALIAANHTSFLDPPLLAISWPERIHFLARESLFRPFLFGRFIRALNTHPVRGNAADISVFRTVCSLLAEGEKVVLFPEGRRSEDGILSAIKPGIGMFISRTETAIIPTYIHGAFEIWPRNKKFPKLWGRTLCVFGSPITWSEFADLDKREAQEAIAQRLSEAIARLKKWVEDGAKGVPP